MTDHQGAVERLTAYLAHHGDHFAPLNVAYPEETKYEWAQTRFKDDLSVLLTAYQAAEALEGAALKYKLAVLAFEAFEAENPNDSGRRWEAVFEARNIAQDALFALLPGTVPPSPGGEGA